MSRLWLGLLFFFPFQPILAADPKELCITPKKPQRSLIYLHGLDPAGFSNQEKNNRKILKKISKQLHMIVYAPRAQNECKNRKMCWLHGSKSLRHKALLRVKEGFEHCSKSYQRIDYILGYSNGGYLAGKLALDCHQESKGAIFFLVGATIKGDILKNLPKPTTCQPSIFFHMGIRDQIYGDAHKAFQHLALEGHKVRWEDFNGGHELKFRSLLHLLQANL